MISSSRQTLLANFIQQACAAALLFALPNMLDKAAYAEIVFVGVLLSFIALADLGLSLVYSRIVPAQLARGDAAAVRQWDTATLTFGLMAAIAFSALIAGLYWFRFSRVGEALLLVILPVGSFWTSFHISRATVTGNFSEYRRVIGFRSVASLLAVPMVATFGLTGWFVSQLAAIFLLMGYVGRRLLESFGVVDWMLVRRHIPEGLMLCAIAVLWAQLLNFGRLYASWGYSVVGIAEYGVAGAAYQSMSTLIISAFLPVSVGVLGRFGKSDAEAFDYLAKALAQSSWIILGGAVIVTEVTPYVFGIVFPGYHFDPWMLFALLMGVAFYPFLILLGNCLVGKRHTASYLTTIILSIVVSTLAAMGVELIWSNKQGAAWGQLIGIVFYTGSLFVVTRTLFHGAAIDVWRMVGKRIVSVALLVGAFGGVRIGWLGA